MVAGMASEGGGDRDGWSRVFVPPRGGRFFRWTVHKRLGVNWTSHRGAKEGRGASATVHSLGGSLSRWVTYAIRWRRLYRMVGWSSSSSSKPQQQQRQQEQQAAARGMGVVQRIAARQRAYRRRSTDATADATCTVFGPTSQSGRGLARKYRIEIQEQNTAKAEFCITFARECR